MLNQVLRKLMAVTSGNKKNSSSPAALYPVLPLPLKQNGATLARYDLWDMCQRRVWDTRLMLSDRWIASGRTQALFLYFRRPSMPFCITSLV